VGWLSQIARVDAEVEAELLKRAQMEAERASRR
jgi:hypothetical protein